MYLEEVPFHFHASAGKRSEGRSAVAAAAYRAGVRLEMTSERAAGQARVQNYSNRYGVIDEGIYAPEGAEDWVYDRQLLWNAVEDAEKRKDAQVFREIQVGLPYMLPIEEQKKMLKAYIEKHFVSQGMVADYAIHEPALGNNRKNIHAHIMLTMRPLDGAGFSTKKNRDWNDKETLLGWRSGWADVQNETFRRLGIDVMADHTAYSDRGVPKDCQKVPQKRLGTTASEMKREGKPTDKGDHNFAIRILNLNNAANRVRARLGVFTRDAVRQELLNSGAEEHVKEAYFREHGKVLPLEEVDAHLNRFLKDYIGDMMDQLGVKQLRCSQGRFTEFYAPRDVSRQELSNALGLSKKFFRSVVIYKTAAVVENVRDHQKFEADLDSLYRKYNAVSERLWDPAPIAHKPSSRSSVLCSVFKGSLAKSGVSENVESQVFDGKDSSILGQSAKKAWLDPVQSSILRSAGSPKKIARELWDYNRNKYQKRL